MYCILNESIALRSWRLVPHAFLTRNCSTAKGVTEEEFGLLLRADGETDLPESEVLQKLIERKLLFPCRKGEKHLSEWQKHIVCDNRYLPMLNLQITGKCNYNCLHCFNCADNEPLQSEMSMEQLLQLLDDCVKCGVTSFTLTGGEPFLHPHFREILAEIYRRNLFVFELNTNGYFINEQILDYMLSIGCKPEMKISFDGLGYHDWMRGHRGAEERTLNAMRLCLRKGFRVRVQMNVNRKNADSIYPTLCLLDEMGIPEVRLIKTTDAPRWEQNAKGMDFSWEEYYSFLAELFRKYSHESHSMAIDVWQTLSYNAKQHYYNVCAAVYSTGKYDSDALICKKSRSQMAIASTGEVYPCMQMQGFMVEKGKSFGNAFRDGLSKVLGESEIMQTVCLNLQDRLEANEECRNCSYLKICHGGCPALAILTNNGGDAGCYLAPDRTKCLMLKEGWYDRIVDAFGEENENLCPIK